MKPLWGAKWFCANECDLPPEKRTKKSDPVRWPPWAYLDFDDEEDTEPTAPVVPTCCGAPMAKFSPTGNGRGWHCWLCGKVK
jgi:hypothetical protein